MDLQRAAFHRTAALEQFGQVHTDGIETGLVELFGISGGLLRVNDVLAVGNGKIGDDGKVRPVGVNVGDKVLFGKYSGQTVKVDGEELLVMREEDIMAVVE